MNRRLFLRSGCAPLAAAALAACGGGGGGPEADPRGPLDAALSSPADAPAVGTSGALPEKVLGCYYTSWDTGRHKITDVPAEFNLIFLFHAKPDGKPRGKDWNNVGNGAFDFQHHDEVPAESIQACRRRGQKVVLTVGGAYAGYAWDNRTKSQNFLASFKGMYARLGGVDGVDFNNYEANILNGRNLAAVTGEMIWIASQLKATYGQAFAVLSPPQPSSPEQQSLMAAMANAGVLDAAGPQHYDWSGFSAPGYIRGRIDLWAGLVGAERTIVGLSADYAQGPSLGDCIREWEAIKAAHPKIRGMFCWSAQHQLAGGNAWGRAMKARM